jgi:Na+-transporting NADH:ubiquinone oxidoreductase subunit C
VKNTVHTLVFAAVLGAACSALLVGASRFTEPYRRANEKAEQVRNYLAALDAPVPAEAGAAELLDVFERDVRRGERDGLELFEYVPGGAREPLAVAVPFSGPGVWGPIEGVIALEPDLTTVRGIRFYKQEETPGLGGEIASAWFQEQFQGKRIVAPDGEPGFHVSKPGTVGGLNNVDAITGATMTSDRVEAMLDSVAKRLLGR